MKILFINPFGIGDVLFTTPVIRALKENFSENFIGYWCNQRVESILRDNPFVDRIFALSRGDLKKMWKRSKLKTIKEALTLRKEIKKEEFDVAVDFSLDSRYGLLAKHLGIKKRIGINYKNRGRFLTHKIDVDYYRDKHVVEYYLDTLQFLNLPRPREPRIEVFLSPQTEEWADNFLKSYGVTSEELLIGVSPGGGESWGKDAIFKHWPSQNYRKLIKLLISNLDVRVIIFGSSSEEKISRVVISNLPEDKVINTAGKITISQFMALVKHCKLLVCNDGGPIHIAVGLEVKTVSIFGPVDERVYGPYPQDENHIVVKKDISCRPCYRNFRFSGCNNQLRCLREISVDEVYSAVLRLLQK